MSHTFNSATSIWWPLLLLISTHSCCEALFEGCNHTYNINPGYSQLESPYYPSYYPPDTSCLYQFIAPLDHQIQVDCSLELDKGTNGCSTEFFYLSTDGDKYLRGSEEFCGTGQFIRNSLFRSVVMAYVSYGSWGRFRCRLNVTPQPCDCGWSVTTKILNGKQTGVNEYPSMVAIRDITSNLPFYCAGSIISHNFILTAAHCIHVQPNPANIAVLVGDHRLSSSTETPYAAQYRIAQLIQHPNYTPNPVTNDIALMRTTQPIEWSRGVGPICLPPPSASTYEYEFATVIGWGTLSFGGPISDTLQKIQLLVLNNSACQESYKTVAPISASQICTYDYTGSSRDSCQYDSGGPVILLGQRQFLIGCISFGKVCGQGGYAVGVNTRISSFLQWIYQTIGFSTCQKTLTP